MAQSNCEILFTIIKEACTANTTASYDKAQDRVAILIPFGRLCEGHERIAENLINTTDDLATIFNDALREYQAVERLLLFKRNLQKADSAMMEIIGLMFPGDPSGLDSRIVRAATDGNLQAKLVVAMYSKTEEEMEALESIRIPVRIVPAGEQ